MRALLILFFILCVGLNCQLSNQNEAQETKTNQNDEPNSESKPEPPAQNEKPTNKVSSNPELELVAESKGVQWTGIALSKTGRLFVNFPRWRDGIPYSLVEIKNDQGFVPYPNGEWNDWEEGQDGKTDWVCVQSVVVDDQDFLWVLDPASPKLAGTLSGAVKIVKINLENDQVEQTIFLEAGVAPEDSYLNDIRIDTRSKHLYITDSGRGAIIIINYETGAQRQILYAAPTTKAESITLNIDGQELTDFNIQSDGIALTPDRKQLYFHALTGYSL